MNTLVELNPTDHKQLKVAANSVAQLASQMQIINITAQEIPQATTEFPVFFTRNSQTGDWGSSILASLLQGVSPMVTEGQWQGLYTPNFLRTYPVFPMRQEDSNTYTLGIDPENDMLTEQSGEALYTEEGKETPYLDSLRRTVDADIKSGYQTFLMTKELDELDLFKSIDLVLQFKDGTRQNLHGLFTINEENFQNLPADKLAEFQQKGYLVIIHAVLLSTYQLNRLIRMHGKIDSKDNVVSVNITEASK